MPTITDRDIEPCSMRLSRTWCEDRPAALVLGPIRRDSPERWLRALADAMFSVVSIGEGA